MKTSKKVKKIPKIILPQKDHIHLPHLHGPFHHKSDSKSDSKNDTKTEHESTPDSTTSKKEKHHHHMHLSDLTKKLHLPHHHNRETGMLANAMRTIAMEPFQLSDEIQVSENFTRFYDKQHSAPAGLADQGEDSMSTRQENVFMSGVESNVSLLTNKAYHPPLLKILPPTPDQNPNPTPFDISLYNKPLYKTNNNFAALLASSSPPDHHRSSTELVPAAASNTTSDDRTTASPAKQPTFPVGHARTESLGMKISQSPRIGDGSNNNSLTNKEINNGVYRRSSDSDLSITPKGRFSCFQNFLLRNHSFLLRNLLMNYTIYSFYNPQK